MFAKLAYIVEGEMARLKRWAYVVHTVFLRHASKHHLSTSGLPEIDHEKLGDLIVEVQSIADNRGGALRPSPEELTRFVKFMDTDQNGRVNEQEMVCFCVQGLRQTPQEHAAFAQRSLIRFLEALGDLCRGDVRHLHIQRPGVRDQAGIHASLFCTYTEEEVAASGGKYDCAECGSLSRALRLDIDDEGGMDLYCELCWIKHYGETFDGEPAIRTLKS